MSQAVMMAASSAISAGMLWQWRRAGTGSGSSAAATTAHADTPPELRTAVSVVTDPAQLAIMWPALGLGSAATGYPNITAAAYTEAGMAVDVQILGGQKLKDWTGDDTLDALAQYLAVDSVTVKPDSPGFVRMELRVRDTLEASAPVSSLHTYGVDLEAVPAGVCDDGKLWSVPILYNHVLLGGTTGSGKSGVVWSLFAGLGPAIHAGLVDLWVIDPKGGMEFGEGERMFVRFECITAEGMLALLQEAVDLMRERAHRLRAAGVRKHVPTAEEPLVVVFIDEAATLSAFADRDTRTKFEELHGLLLSQGRAVGFSVIETVIDPSKDTVPQRQLFPCRIGLRLSEGGQVPMILGQGAAERGARCTEIPASTPGVAYVEHDGSTELGRVRAFWVSDSDIARIVDTYAPTPPDITTVIDPDFDPDDLGDEELLAA